MKQAWVGRVAGDSGVDRSECAAYGVPSAQQAPWLAPDPSSTPCKSLRPPAPPKWMLHLASKLRLAAWFLCAGQHPHCPHTMSLAAIQWHPPSLLAGCCTRLSRLGACPSLQAGRFTHAVRTFQLDQFLAPYDLASYNRWRQLSSHVSADVVDAVQPVGGNISVLAEADPAALRPATAAEEALYEQLKQGHEAQAAAQDAAQQGGAAGADAGAGTEGMQVDQQPGTGAAAAGDEQQQQGRQEGAAGRWAAAPHAGRCFFTPLPRLVKRGGLTPAELTGGWPRPACRRPHSRTWRRQRIHLSAQRSAPLVLVYPACLQHMSCHPPPPTQHAAHTHTHHTLWPTCPPASALNLDKSRVLEEVLDKHFKGSEEAFLGEGPPLLPRPATPSLLLPWLAGSPIPPLGHPPCYTPAHPALPASSPGRAAADPLRTLSSPLPHTPTHPHTHAYTHTHTTTPAGEFQFAFLAFLVGQSLEAFAQWKAYLCLMFGCDDAPLGRRAALFAAFLKALHAQLEHSLAPVSSGSRPGGPGGAAGGLNAGLGRLGWQRAGCRLSLLCAALPGGRPLLRPPRGSADARPSGKPLAEAAY